MLQSGKFFIRKNKETIVTLNKIRKDKIIRIHLYVKSKINGKKKSNIKNKYIKIYLPEKMFRLYIIDNFFLLFRNQ